MKPFNIIAIIIFVVVACLHLLRLIQGWEIVFSRTVGNVHVSIVVPMWMSVAGCIVAALLAVMLWRERKK